jgi:hypothetical protein
MTMQSALGPYEGAFASRVLGYNLEVLAPYASALAGSGAFRAGVGGLLQGRFGWGTAAGYALNTPTLPGDVLGVVIPLRSVNAANGGVVGGPAAFGGPVAFWSWQTWDTAARAWRMRQGIVATLMPTGNFWLKFAGGANYGDTVYASLTDGSAISGSGVENTVVTPFKVCSECNTGGLALVSSTAQFF